LNARNLNVNDAAKMFTDSMKWREENDVDSIVERLIDEPHVKALMKYWPCSGNGEYFAKNGWPLFHLRVGPIDTNFLLTHYTPTQILEWHLICQEKREQLRQQQYEEIGFSNGALWILDCGGLGIKHLHPAGIEVLSKMKEVDTLNYPESVSRMYFVNVPSIFGTFWTMVKIWFDKHFLDKTRIHASNYYDEFVTLVEEELLPVYLGGTRENVAPGGGSDSSAFFNDEDHIEEIVVPARDSRRIQIEVELDNTILEWKFMVESNDIKLNLLDSNGKAIEQTQAPSSIGNITASAGTYTLEFDNKYSWTRQKKIEYTLTMRAVQENN